VRSQPEAEPGGHQRNRAENPEAGAATGHDVGPREDVGSRVRPGFALAAAEHDVAGPGTPALATADEVRSGISAGQGRREADRTDQASDFGGATIAHSRYHDRPRPDL